MKLIDADALIDFIENRYEITWDSGTYEGGIKDACSDILEKIDNMENIKPETNCSEIPNNWTPCTPETMPEESGAYICTCIDAGRLMVTQIKWQPKLKSWNLSGARSYWKVIAWQEIKPYQPKEE